MKIYLGIIGKSFAGKETVYKIIKKLAKSRNLKTSIHRFSDPLNEMLNVIHLPLERPYQQKFSTMLRQGFGEEILGNEIMIRARVDLGNIVCLDGIRRPQDVIKLRKLPNSYLVFVDRPPKNRFESGKKRKDRAVQTWEQFVAEQSAESENKIDEIAKEAKIILDNSGNKKSLRGQIEKKILPLIVAKSPVFFH